MDKEIEELLHSLNIQADFSLEKGVDQQGKQEKPASVGSFSFGFGIVFLCIGISLLSAFGCAFFLLKKEPSAPIRMVELSEYSDGAFFLKKEERSVATPFSLSTFDEVSSHSENKEDAFFNQSPYADDLFVKELQGNEHSLFQKKKSIIGDLDKTHVFSEKEALRSLSNNFDLYLRSQLMTSAAFESQLKEKKGYMDEEEKSAWDLFLNLYGGVPLVGCKASIEEMDRIRKELIRCRKLFQEDVSFETHFCAAMEGMKLLEKISQDRLLSSLINGKEERKKLEEGIMLSLSRFEKQRVQGQRYSIKEWRALCFMKWCLSKKAIVDWQMLDKGLFQKAQYLPIEEENNLLCNGSSFCTTTKRIDW